ncbi:MAG: hypothetical protein ACR2QJ_05475 [Geminicoccaceae bacterium]
MRNFQGSESQGGGSTGFNRLSVRKGQHQSNIKKSSDAISEVDPAQLIALMRKSHIEHRQRKNGHFQHGSQLARDKARQQATDAAIAAYQDALRSDDPKQEACKAAIQAYLEIYPNETDVSDQVAKAIIHATVKSDFQTILP